MGSIVRQCDSDSTVCRIVVDGAVRTGRTLRDADTIPGGWWTGV